MLGAITGDIIGSIYEGASQKSTDFPLFRPYSKFTDDTVMTIAVADAIIHNKPYAETMQEWGRKYPKAGYGGNFFGWIHNDPPEPYNSWGNGAAMRVSPVGFAFNSIEKVLNEAKKSAEISHNHPEGIKGAQSVASAIFMARNNNTKTEIKNYVEENFGYNLSRNIDDIRPDYHFEVSCQTSVPEAIIAFLESEDVEDAIRLAVSLGGDSDTQGCIAGGIAYAFYKELSAETTEEVKKRLTKEMLDVLFAFQKKYAVS